MGQNKKKASKNKNKGKKNEPSTSGTVDDDDFDDLTDGFDDDGVISQEDCDCFCKLVFSETSTLRQLGSELLEKFKNRSMLSVGTSLSVMYEYLYSFDQLRNNEDHLRPRLILVYLIYRCREIEPMMKRKTEKRKETLMGHPFADFILRLVHEESNEICSSVFEHNFASLILCRRGVELGSLEVKKLPDVAGTLTLPKSSELASTWKELNDWRQEYRSLWPKSFERLSGTTLTLDQKDSSERKPLVVAEFVEHMKDLLCEEEPYCVLEGLDIPIEASYLLDKHPLWRFASEANTVGVNSASSSKESKLNDSSEAIVSDKEISDVIAPPSPSTEDSRKKLQESIADVVAKIDSGGELNYEDTILAHGFMSLVDANDPISQKLRGANIKKLAFDNFTSLVSTNHKVASDLLYKLVLMDKDMIDGILVMFCLIDVSVQVLEIVRRLYENIPDLPREPLHRYIVHCLDYSQKVDLSVNQKTRCVRLVCMFTSSMIKQKFLDVKDISTQLQTFCLNFNQLKEATSLYQLLVELNKKVFKP